MTTYNLLGATPDDIKQLGYDDFYSEDFTNELYGEELSGSERLRIKGLAIRRAAELGFGPEYKEYLSELEAEQDDYNDTDKFTKTTNFGIEGWQSLNCGDWIADRKGIRKKKAKLYASRIPIQPVEILENKTSGVEKVKLQFYKNGKTRYKIVERNIIAAKNRIVQLASQGIEVNSESSGQLVQYLSDVINLNPLTYTTAYSQMGWHDNKFIPYDSDAVFDSEDTNRFLFNAFRSHGDLNEWVERMAHYRENLPIRLAMGAAFASVILEKLGALPFVFHLWGKSGTGKTVALMIAMSIWGDPNPGATVRTLNMTQNAMIGQAALLNSLPFAGDELQTIKERFDNYDKLIMRCTEGIDRGRMIDGQRAAETKRWKCAFLFTGEDKCTRPNSGAGVKNRCIEVEVDSELLEGEGNNAVNFISNNYGLAGREFIRKIQSTNADGLRLEYNATTQALAEKAGTEPKQAAAMAAILLADTLARESFWRDEKPLDFNDVIPFIASAEEISIATRAYNYVIDIIAKNHKRFSSLDDNKGEIWGGFRGEYVWFNSTALKDVLQREGFEFNSVAKTWVKRGLIKRNSEGKNTVSGSVEGIKARYVVIKMPDTAEQDEEDYDGIEI